METLTPEIQNIVKAKPKIEEQKAEILVLAISTNFLAIVKQYPPKSSDDFDILLDGNDNDIAFIAANTPGGYKEMYDVIDACYLARETNQTVEISVRGIKIYFH